MIQELHAIKAECESIQSFLEITVGDNIEEIAERGNDLAVYIARTGKMLADSKYHRNKALSTSIVREMGKQANIPPSVLSKLVDAATFDENYVADWVERLNRTATHQLDWMRTLTSKAKEEMRLSNPISQR
ncbi:hypothetical protein LX69_01113 [Breznakibacter xylanolyticus]|uniref:Uncharacterized protein n=1 Tax=Breznakibacter xylanolyticus TaxID=990 RepID=A0A2W7NXS4_9BACT|nr:hypothetical protein [Breznakibacter xylanolyticus]PZX18076.1 hypothetical protein LX69_01113 [Breznakibacter xylanolyticus]